MLKTKEFKKLYDNNKYDYVRKIQEECNELASVISHFLDDKKSIADVVDEMADIQIQYDKILLMIAEFDDEFVSDIESLIEDKIEAKEFQLRMIINGLDNVDKKLNVNDNQYEW